MGTHLPMPKPWAGEGKDVLAVEVRHLYQKWMDSKECTKYTEGSIPGPSCPFWESLRSSQMPLP